MRRILGAWLLCTLASLVVVENGVFRLRAVSTMVIWA